ncbi:MAG: cyanophycin synthetase [Chitinophagaceae bacterium]|nr:cyanophycin synthetase [Chitinophagaceae bacterium]MBL0067637.1 cyanophycin synthetase [Chitinophagaceae bacterium]MBP6233261.1 cyanophycin synthetase [Chitinophagaceae bacterium]MBP6414954.1 cyanophycin synthetase [Chitinophagaceae bacterium]HQW44331.1 cyanophycin synthetase [Chitinophagaceae bacterium]
MQILEIKVLKGPNYWSVRRTKLIQMKLDLEEKENMPTNKITGFRERLEKLLPSLYEHRCSVGKPGGFFERVDEGTWMGHVIEHIALEIQTLAGMDTGFGRTRTPDGEKEGVYYVVFSYMEEDAGLYAAKAAVRIAHSLIEGTEYDLANDIQQMREIREDTRLGPSTGCIVDEAAKRGIPYIRLNKASLVQLGYGVNQKRIRATIASTTSNIAVDIACDKEETKMLLEAAEIPVPRGTVIRTEEGMDAAIAKYGYPLVIKPIDGNHGKGNTTNITNRQQAIKAFEAAKAYSRSVIIERFLTGYDFRCLVINNKFICAALRTPASVVGDGIHNIQWLIDETNRDPRRGFGHEKVLTQITIDQFTQKMMDDAEITLDHIPSNGERVLLKPTANLSTGGTSTDVTDEVHPANIFMFERIARIIGLDICGIDVMATDLRTPVAENGGAILEVNAAPGFRMHIDPSEGLPRNVAEPVVDMLFPKGSAGRIPIIAITGTNGKTTTTRLTAHIAKSAGKKVGYTTSDGVYIQNQLMMKGDCTGPVSSTFVLKDPTVDFAVLECARGGILKSGLAFQNCEVAVVTNVAADHMGLGGIHTLEAMAKVKAVVPETVFPHGYAVLNADDDLVYKMKKDLKCNIGLFSMDENNPRIKAHCAENGLACVYENGYVTIMKGNWKIRVLPARDIPLTYEGKAVHNINNCLPAVLSSYLFRDITIDDIKTGLQTFIPSESLTPGRLNFFHFKHFTMLADFAHNPHGLKLLCDFVSKLDYPIKIGVISGTGDRRDEDIRELGEISARYFDEIIIRCDKNLRGRTAEEIIELLQQGIRNVNPDIPIITIPNEDQALDYIYENAKPGALYTIMCDVVARALDKIRELKQKEEKEGITLSQPV